MVSLLGANNIRTDQFFNLKGLSQSAVERLEKAVKSSRETLALADQLQAVRDTNKSIEKLERNLRYSTGINIRFVDFLA
mgnify:CR=1 FL=1